MPNSLGPTGITLAPQAELIAYFTAQFQTIYGPNINLASNSPDGQAMNIFIQAILDLSDLLMQVYNSFDPDNAFGVVLDQRVALNGIQRQAGTYSTVSITIVTTQALNLYGLDQVLTTAQPVYTIADNAGNQWQLQTTVNLTGAGTYTLMFQAAVPGAVVPIPNTITTAVTIILGVSSINNPVTYSTLGIAEETDAALKLRRQKSVSLASQGYVRGLLAALQNINGVSSATVLENLTNATNADGVPSHSIWVIVAGTGSNAAIANAIYTKRGAGAGMYGSTSYNVTQADGSQFTVYWDTVVPQNLFIRMTVSSLDGVNTPNVALIRTNLPLLLNPGVYAEVDINQIATLVRQIEPNALVTNAGLSTGLVQSLTFGAVPATGAFSLAYNGVTSAAINFNDPLATVLAKINAITGLGSATVSGTPTAGPIVINLNVASALSLITVVTNTTGVTITPSAVYSNSLFPSSKKYQFTDASTNIVITPLLFTPITALVTHATTRQFTVAGGYGTLTYSIPTNGSGGTISASGLYTAGATYPSTDIVQVTDAYGNTAQSTVTVI